MQCKIILPSGSRCQSVCCNADSPTCVAHASGRRSAMHKLDLTLPNAEPSWLEMNSTTHTICYKDASLGRSFSTITGTT
jgi:hypothetical protein